MVDAAFWPWLRSELADDVAAIADPADSPSARRAVGRLHAVLEQFPDFLALLVEPWEPVDASLCEVVLDCARIHLYARVLDDALDENLPVNRRHLLRAQPLFWRAVYGIGSRYPALSSSAGALISVTTGAVARDDLAADPDSWGRKNLHLLLAPMLLAEDAPSYRAASAGLTSLIGLAQAREEAQQGALRDPAVRQSLLQVLPQWLDPAVLETMHQHGWTRAAARLLHDGQALMRSMDKQTNAI